MCGLVSVINKRKNGFFKQQIDIFAALLFIDYFRGQDSTGVFMVDNKGDVMIAKEASNPIDFMQSKEFEEIVKAADRRGSALVGHNRKATRGTVNDENAHPFWVDDKIVLVHNGTMYGDHKKHADVEVDSHAIAHIIHEKGGNVEEALSSFNAAYALIWYDFDNKRLNITRNNERPLWWIESNDDWIIASEKSFLEFIINKFDLRGYNGPNSFTPNDLQMMSLEDQSWKGTYRSLRLSSKTTSTPGVFYPVRTRTFDPDTGVPDLSGLTWGSDEFEDIPFENESERLRRALALQEQKADERMIQVETKPANEEDVNALNHTTFHYERNLARNNNCNVPRAQFYNDIVERYIKGNTVTAVAFDYTYANQKDDTSGYFLYLKVWDDTDVLCRLWFSPGVGQGRIEQMAGTGYVYELMISRKWWQSFKSGDNSQTTPGYVMIETQVKQLLYGGGMGDKEWAEKLTRGVVKH